MITGERCALLWQVLSVCADLGLTPWVDDASLSRVDHGRDYRRRLRRGLGHLGVEGPEGALDRVHLQRSDRAASGRLAVRLIPDLISSTTSQCSSRARRRSRALTAPQEGPQPREAVGQTDSCRQIPWPPDGQVHDRYRAASWPSRDRFSCPLSIGSALSFAPEDFGRAMGVRGHSCCQENCSACRVPRACFNSW